MHNSQAQERPVIAVYDIRGIQDFIFRTNRVKDIIGASDIVARVLTDSIRAWFEEQQDAPAFRFDWLDGQGAPGQAFAFDADDGVRAEVLYIGGGNAYVAYRDARLAEQANRFIARRVLRETHTLSLASACVYMTDDYLSDQRRLMQRLARVKAEGRTARAVAGFPFTVEEQGSGLPCVRYEDGGRQRISTETLRKRERYQELAARQKAPYFALEFDKMVEQKGRNSILAVVHLDGNSLGSGIQAHMQGCGDYAEAVLRMRKLSAQITDTFEQVVFQAMVQCLAEKGIDPNDRKNPLPMRPIIMAGDDLTFICRADLALDLTQACLDAVSTRNLAGDTPPGSGFSACAGIVYANSHFPFSQSYALAEELCALAKQKAKTQAASTNGRVGSYVDFHICYKGNVDDIESLRGREYVTREGQLLLQRPCRADRGAERGPDHLETLKAQIAHLKAKVPRSAIKKARDAYHQTQGAVELAFAEAASLAGRALSADPGTRPFDENGRATLYDALEMFDIFGSAGLEPASGGNSQ